MGTKPTTRRNEAGFQKRQINLSQPISPQLNRIAGQYPQTPLRVCCSSMAPPKITPHPEPFFIRHSIHKK